MKDNINIFSFCGRRSNRVWASFASSWRALGLIVTALALSGGVAWAWPRGGGIIHPLLAKTPTEALATTPAGTLGTLP